jgi:hypothetical protein
MRRILFFLACLALCGRAFAADPVPASKAPELEGFASGPWKGKNAVFQAKNFDAIFGADRLLYIQPKEEGKDAGPPVRVSFSVYYTRDLRSVARELISYEKKPAPSMQPKKLELAGVCSERVRFSFTYEFSEDGITIHGELKEPSTVKAASVLGYAVVFPAVPKTTAATTPEEAEPLTSGCELKLVDAKKQAKSLRFTEFPPTTSNSVLHAEVSGLWGTRRVLVDAPPTRKNGERVANLGNYGSQALYKGGWYFSRGSTDKLEGGPLTIRIE